MHGATASSTGSGKPESREGYGERAATSSKIPSTTSVPTLETRPASERIWVSFKALS